VRTLLIIATFLAALPAAAGSDLLSEPMVDLEGRPASLADYAGEVLLVNFWASWCPPCRRELPLLEAWQREWAGQARVVAVSIDREAANAARFVDDTGLTLAVLVDGPDGLAAGLDLAAVPTTYLLDRRGDVALVVHGSDRDDLARLKRAAEALMTPVVGRLAR
jgi:thiol-disulfide isomerase/thioredoxin